MTSPCREKHAEAPTMTTVEIARELGISKQSVHNIIHSALRKCRAYMECHGRSASDYYEVDDREAATR